MKKHLLKTMVCCAACWALGAQAQGYSGGSTAPGSTSSGSESSGSQGQYSPTGRMGHQEVRASQISSANVTSTAGQSLGSISDTIVNPTSGRIDFAIISLSSSAGTSTSGTSTSATGAKEVAVPWTLLRASSMAAGATTSQTPSFTYTGDTSKLEAAPAFDAGTDLAQSNWRQTVFSYFGLSGAGTATGGAETPGGTSGGTSPNPPGSSGQ